VEVIGLTWVYAGAALLVAGGVWLFGPVALLVAGVALIAAGLLVDWEALSGKSAQPPRR
jgi:hypothetical protein